MHPWLFPFLAGWLWLHHGFFCAMSVSVGWVSEPPLAVGWLLGVLSVSGVVWAVLVQLRRIEPRGGTGFILAGFGVWVVQLVDTLALVFVEWPPHYLSSEQFGQTRATLCIGAGYVAFAVGVGLVVGDAVASWQSRPAAHSPLFGPRG